MNSPAGFLMRTQTPAANTIASPRQTSPAPSRWWSGCRSRAPRPMWRTANPTAPAIRFQAAAMVRNTHLARMTTGSRVGFCPLRLPAAPFFPPPVLPPLLPERPVAVPPPPRPPRGLPDRAVPLPPPARADRPEPPAAAPRPPPEPPPRAELPRPEPFPELPRPEPPLPLFLGGRAPPGGRL